MIEENNLSFNKFSELLNKWSDDVSMQSLIGRMQRHPNYKKILSYENKEDIMGYACLFLDKHFFVAMLIIGTLVPEEKHPPIDSYYAGRTPVICECWKFWALEQKILFTKYDVHSYWQEDKYGNSNKSI